MGLRNVREEGENVVDGELEAYLRVGVAALDHQFYRFVLPDELFLHRPPHHLQGLSKQIEAP